MRIIQAVDSGDASAVDLDKIISTDPPLAAKVLRLANAAAVASTGHEVSTIRMAILRLGTRSVRALAFSILAQKLANPGTGHGFRPERLAHHSMCVGFLARYLYARRHQKGAFATAWSADEVFAAGLLHELSTPLLAQVAPDVFLRVKSLAQRTNMTLEAAFDQIFNQPIHSLACAAAEAWGLPEIFVTVFSHISEPWSHPDEFSSLCCLNYANFLAAKHGSLTEDWPVQVCTEPEVESEVCIPQEESDKVMDLIREQVATYLSISDPSSRAKAA